jgi:dephospho-CoA kinase
MSPRQPRWILCGGIGSGKSEVRRILDNLGVRTIDADSVGHSVLEPGGDAFEPVAERWPTAVSEGRIDRKALGVIVFSDGAELEALERVTHPLIFGRIRSDVEGFPGPVAVELPVLNDSLGEGWRRIVVDAPDVLRLSRAMARGLSDEEARSRMASQPSRGEWLATADLVIPNWKGLDELADVVEKALTVITS